MIETVYSIAGAPRIALLTDLHNHSFSAVISSLQTHRSSMIAIGYVQLSAETNGNTTIFTNGLYQRPEVEDEEEKPKVPGETLYIFDEYETPLGVEVMINHVGDCFD